MVHNCALKVHIRIFGKCTAYDSFVSFFSESVGVIWGDDGILEMGEPQNLFLFQRFDCSF